MSIIVRNAELNGLEMDLGSEGDDRELQYALDCAPGAVFFHLRDGRRVCADTNLGRRIVDALFLNSNKILPRGS